MYTEEMALIAKRENNTKRNYLVVNKYQGKHIPVDPGKALGMFSALAGLVEGRYQGERLLLVGFAETATAIGEALAVQLGADYMQTTREQIKGVEYLYFSESHSHATEQKVVKDDLDAVILGAGTGSKPDLRIVFVEDEVTTGNTVLGIIQLMRKEYGERLRFSVASLLNGMDGEAQEKYRNNGIDMVYLVKTDHSGYPELAGRWAADGVYHKCQPFCRNQSQTRKLCPIKQNPSGGCGIPGMEISAPGYINARRLHKGADYQAACGLLWQGIQEKISFGAGQEVLVLGTEEFMYAPLYVAQKIQELGSHVRCHATTRSPIMVGKSPSYPLHERYELVSLYDAGRTTYLYDLAKYDLVLVITDAEPEPGRKDNFPKECGQGIDVRRESGAGKEIDFLEKCKGKIDALEEPGKTSLCNAIYHSGSRNIYFVRWCGE